MHEDEAVPLTERKVVRRGLIGGIAGLGAAALLKLTGAGRAEAGHDTTTAYASAGVLHLGVINDGGHSNQNLTDTLLTERTALVANVDRPTFQAMNSNTGTRSTGVFGSANGTGPGVAGAVPAQGLPPVDAYSGVFGLASDVGAPGVLGRTIFSDPGVRGETSGGTGVFGVSKSTSPAAVPKPPVHAGVVGQGFARLGVRGVSDSQPGVEGVSVSSLGVRGLSTSSVGIVGISTGNHGLYGSTSSAVSAGFVGENLAGGLAGYFAGNVFITGSLQVAGAKNAVIKMQDGTSASVYCQESPEPYFEDFGRAQLAGGVASVTLEREFATLVAGADYHVFLTPEGDTRGLFVSRRGPGGFEVREVGGGTGSVPFSYRIVTKRKDIEGRRFARVTDNVGQTLAASRAALGVTGAPPVNPGLPQSSITPPIPLEPNPLQPSPTAPNNQAAPGPLPPNPDHPGLLRPR